MLFAYINLQMSLLSYKNRHSTEHRTLEFSARKLFTPRRKRAWTAPILVPVVGNSIKQCSQSILLVFKGNGGRWWHLLEMLIQLPGQNKNAEVKAFFSILTNRGIFIKLPAGFEHNFLPCSHGTFKKTHIRSQIFQFKCRSNSEDQPFPAEAHGMGGAASALHRV